jgi:RNA polymerase sigma-70 factor, ECF subfamily
LRFDNCQRYDYVAMPASLAATFRSVAGSVFDADDSELEAELQTYLAAAHAAWPELSMSDSAFVSCLAERSAEGRMPERACAPDLFLVCACAQRLPAAREVFHTTYAPVVARVLRRRGATAAELQDAQQAVFEKLLVADASGRARLSDYKGHGPLKSWVSSVAATTLLMLQRTHTRRRERPQNNDLLLEQAIEDGPELRYLKQRYKAPVEAAIVHALSRLGDRERVLLRLHLCERSSIDHLGAMYGVNRATAARWLARARAGLLEETRAEIRRTLALSESECDSILKLVDSQLDVSIARHLDVNI